MEKFNQGAVSFKKQKQVYARLKSRGRKKTQIFPASAASKTRSASTDDGNLQTVNDRAKTQRQHCIAQLISRANARQKRADRETRVRAQRAYKQYATKTARSATKVCAVFRARLLFADAELGKNFGYNLFRSGFARNFAERFPCFLHGNGKQIQRRGVDIRQRGF